MKTKSKMILAAAGLSTMGIAAGATAVSAMNMGPTTSVSTNVDNGGMVTKPVGPTTNTNTNTNTNIGSNNVSIPQTGVTSIVGNTTTTSSRNNYGFQLTRITSRSVDSNFELTDGTPFLMSITENNKEEGKIYLMDEYGNEVESIVVTPGKTVHVGVKLNENFKDYTVRELKVWGADANHFVPTEKSDRNPNEFIIHLPTVEQSTNLDGSNWMYGPNVTINVQPTFILGAIGNNTNWEHGALQGDLNGYVYEMTKDTKWSEIEKELRGAFDNRDDKEHPIDVYIYFNGYDLTMDIPVNNPTAVSSGWNLNFINNKYDQIDPVNGYGEIRIDSNVKDSGLFLFGGSITVYRSVAASYAVTSNGVQFIDINNHSWIGTITNIPEGHVQDKK